MMLFNIGIRSFDEIKDVEVVREDSKLSYKITKWVSYGLTVTICLLVWFQYNLCIGQGKLLSYITIIMFVC